MSSQGEHIGVEVDDVADALDDCGLEIVVLNLTRNGAPSFESCGVTTQKICGRVIQKKLQKTSSPVGDNHHEREQTPLSITAL
jgi:hypothetical protein